MLKPVNNFRKTTHVVSLTGFWICLCFCTKSLKDMKKLIILTFYCRHFYCIFLFLLRFVIINTFKKKTIEMKQSILDLCFLRSHRNCFFFKKLFIKISQNSQENTCTRVSFLINLQVRRLQLYWTRKPGTGVVL